MRVTTAITINGAARCHDETNNVCAASRCRTGVNENSTRANGVLCCAPTLRCEASSLRGGAAVLLYLPANRLRERMSDMVATLRRRASDRRYASENGTSRSHCQTETRTCCENAIATYELSDARLLRVTCHVTTCAAMRRLRRCGTRHAALCRRRNGATQQHNARTRWSHVAVADRRYKRLLQWREHWYQ